VNFEVSVAYAITSKFIFSVHSSEFYLLSFPNMNQRIRPRSGRKKIRADHRILEEPDMLLSFQMLYSAMMSRMRMMVPKMFPGKLNR
jgi:hypothetical protein